MEELEALLMTYNLAHPEEIETSPWSKMYSESPFPKYWRLVYRILSDCDRRFKVVEVGGGPGNVIVIPCYLGYEYCKSFEMDQVVAGQATRKIKELFHRDDVIISETFPKCGAQADLLIMVNCVYKEMGHDKRSYIKTIKTFYEGAGRPKIFILEVIDASYQEPNDIFPEYVRLDRNDILRMFPDKDIQSWATYRYPVNSKSKTLYLIKDK